MNEIKQFKNTFAEIVKDMSNTNKVYNNTKYQDIISYEKRCEDSLRLCLKYPDYVPVIINSPHPEVNLKKNKFLVQKDSSASKLVYTIRSQLILNSNMAIFMFINDTIIDHTKSIGDLYEQYIINIKDKNNDKYMYVNIYLENTFGNF
jgi:hypothetical protein